MSFTVERPASRPSSRGDARLSTNKIGSGTPELPSLLLDSLPGSLHMSGLSVGLADAESKRKFAIELGMREVQAAAAIQPVHQKLIRLISRAQPEADKIEMGGSGEFEA